MDLRTLRLFVAAMETGSITKADHEGLTGAEAAQRAGMAGLARVSLQQAAPPQVPPVA